MFARDDDGAVAREEIALCARPPIVRDELRGVQLAAVPRAVQRETCRAEHAVARLEHGKPEPLLSADARPEVTVHELDDRPLVGQAVLHFEAVHVVREADVGRPPPNLLECRVDAAGDAELLEPVGLGRGKLCGLRVAMQDHDRVTACGQAGHDAIEIALDAARVAEPVVGQQHAHQTATP